MPRSARRSARGPSSVKRELPPSMTTSPAPSSPASSSMVASVTSAGTITQTARGGGQLAATSSARPATSETSGLRS